MGILRIILALSVLAVHVGPLFGLRFFGEGVMAVQTFYMLSGFYMALVLSSRYRGQTRDFYFNRFLRLFPLYWMLVAGFLVVSSLYWIAFGHPLGALFVWRHFHNPLQSLWAVFSNVFMVGTDWAELYSYTHSPIGDGLNRLIAIEAMWSVAVEITFYVAAPYIMRLRVRTQGALFLAALLLRIGIWVATGSQWSAWVYFFAPAAWVFFMGGVVGYHLMVWFQKQPWFVRRAVPIGRMLIIGLVPVIMFYDQAKILRFDDWRYYLAIGLALPFLFTAFKDSTLDAALARYSYPIYLAQSVVMSLSAPTQSIVPALYIPYVVLACTLCLSFVVLIGDDKIQRRFKRMPIRTTTTVKLPPPPGSALQNS